MCAVAFELAGEEVAYDDTASLAVDDDDVDELVAVIHCHCAAGDLAVEGLVDAEEELLAGLAFGIEGALDLYAAEGAIGQVAAVFAGEGHSYGHAVVDDLEADFGESVDIGFAGAVVAAFDGVVKQSIDGIAVVLVVFCGVDTALGCDAVCPSWAIVKGKAFDLVAQLTEGGRCAASCQSCAHYDDFELALVIGGDEFLMVFKILPFLMKRPRWHFAVERPAFDPFDFHTAMVI